MKTITTVFLINTLRATLDSIEQTPGIDPTYPGLVEIKQTLQQKIAQLRSQDEVTWTTPS